VKICIKTSEIFDLDKTLSCGQCFRWFKKSDCWVGVVGNCFASIKQNNGFLKIDSSLKDKHFWESYFDLNFDYQQAAKSFFSHQSVLSQAAKENCGIHILNQDPWEVLCSFIISQNNNIPRIKSIIDKLCTNFGEKIGTFYTFPTFSRISLLNLDDLSVIKSGFRAKYILDASQALQESRIDLRKIKFMNIERAMECLQTIKGVGPKVASCTLLYGFHRLECFPIDTWIKKVLCKYEIDHEKLGNNKGLSQIYLFNWSRSHPELFLRAKIQPGAL